MASEKQFSEMFALTEGSNGKEFPSDDELLSDFVRQQDATAFKQIVERHASMVLGICRRVLRQNQDAEDACQAVFLILARRASSIMKGESIASWLHGVAFRTASNLRRGEARRRRREQAASIKRNQGADVGAERVETPARGFDPQFLNELRGVLDEELNRLPTELRAPLVLCYYEGKTRDEAAATLGWSLSKLKSRLSQARDALQCRLKKRGVVLSLAMLGVAFSQTASAAASETMITQITLAASPFASGNTIPADSVNLHAVQLAEAIMKSMGAMNLKVVAILSLTAGMLAGTTRIIVNQASAKQAVRSVARNSPSQSADALVPTQLPKTPVFDRAFHTEIQPAQIAPPIAPRPIEQAIAEVATPATASKADRILRAMPEMKVGDFTVRVQRAAWITTSDLEITVTGNPFTLVKQVANQSFSPAATKHGSQGAAATVNGDPQIFIDFEITPLMSENRQLIVEIAAKATGWDETSQSWFSPELKPPFGFRILESSGLVADGKHQLFLQSAQPSARVETIKELSGELLITEAVISAFQFLDKDLRGKSKKAVVRRTKAGTLTLGAIRRSEESVEIELGFLAPPATAVERKQSVAQRLANALQMEIAAEISDADGNLIPTPQFQIFPGNIIQTQTLSVDGGGNEQVVIHRETGASGPAAGPVPRFGIWIAARGTGAAEPGRQGESTDSSLALISTERLLNFMIKLEPLPADAILNSLTVSLTQRTGETKHLPFTFPEIPIDAEERGRS